ncbi:hypothetical protein PsorP6_017137 [Peronosclerospora sorghi]|uniref:Uncharacterized protein n=1 Tax=Peronosclerospora sorghi TaxID=230839 RepID=A0ACC0WDU0_9STRA|nr:hypothetical protein PsorP6_017137 [Peronosclerospora sorghi]
MDDNQHWMKDEDAAEEELRLLEAMMNISSAVQNLNQELIQLNRQTVDLSKELGRAERNLNALYLPFQAVIYDIQSSSSNGATLSMPMTRESITPEIERTEL